MSNLEFTFLRIPFSPPLNALRVIRLAVDLVETLFQNHDRVSATLIRNTCRQLFDGADHMVSMPLVFPNVSNTDRRRQLWGRCVTLMLMTMTLPADLDPAEEIQTRSLEEYTPPPTASKTDVARIPSCKYNTVSKKRKRGRERDACAICLVKFRSNSKVKQLQCGHVFHAKCIDKSLRKTNLKCCVCRQHVDFDLFPLPKKRKTKIG